jgi:hypothetical protein
MRLHIAFTAVAALILAGCATPPVAQPTATGNVDAKAAFAKLKTLAGDWEGGIGTPDGPKGAVTYRVTGAGSALVETQFPGSPHEMVTVYYVDGSDLVLTHYCAAQNQPRMKLARMTDSEFVFQFTGGSNLDPAKDMHMHDATMKIVGPGRLESTWFAWSGGKPDPNGVGRFYLGKKGG